ncbi:hypothetical protein [uncultured Anaerococcus sp.]|uniref:hypothetical protein n=1 Tax=uncultured Anaerococcus sp. TaxID=293428 RepID=UPI0028895763|nr:hypothetical protein [uncultured Anaerococcus sp.]
MRIDDGKIKKGEQEMIKELEKRNLTLENFKDLVEKSDNKKAKRLDKQKLVYR